MELEPLEELSKRERLSMKFIVAFMEKDPFHRPPTQVELLQHLNEVLPKQPDGRPALVSTQQTHRIVTSLRVKGWLQEIPDQVRVNRNMYPTRAGQALAKPGHASRPSTLGN